MIYFLRTYDLETIRLKFITIYILNVSDALLTHLLIRTGYFIEVNFLLKEIVGNINRLFIMKILFPALLIAWLYFRVQQTTEKILKQSNIAVNFVLVLYIFINILHIIWLIFFVVRYLLSLEWAGALRLHMGWKKTILLWCKKDK